MKHTWTLLLFVILLFLSFWAINPLLQPGFFPIHDDEQVGRLYELDQSLKAGHFPVRISQHLGFGYGYPLFNFYPSFVYYVAEIFVLLGFGYISSIKLMIGLGFLLASFFMYLFAKEYFGRYGGIISAIAYMYVPYHSLDVYVRGAIPEFWSFVFVPAIFWSFKKNADTPNPVFILMSAVFIAGLILTHNLVAMMSGFFLVMYLLYLISESKNKLSFILSCFLSGILGFALSAFFWIPSFFERNTTMIKLLTMETADYNQHFVYLRQLWNSPWGYGGSLAGLGDGISFEIGKVHILGVIFSAILGLVLFVRKNTLWKLLFLFLAVFALAAIMTSYNSHFLWDHLQFFAYIQFPWRFLLFTAFVTSFLLGSLVLFFSNEKKQIITMLILVLVIIFTYKDFFKPSQYLTSVTDENYISLDVIKWRTSIMAFEYVPNGIATKNINNSTKVDITENEVASRSALLLKGNLVIQEVEIKPYYKKLLVKGTGGIMRINQFYYPGWKVFIDGREMQYNVNNKLKLLDVSIPRGEHTVEAIYTDTAAKKIGNSISVASILAIILYIIVFLRKSKNTNEYEKGKKRKNK